MVEEQSPLKRKVKEFGLTSFAVDNGTSFFIITLMIVIFGIGAYESMPKEQFPEVSFPTVYVNTPYFGNSAADIENLVTRPIEKEIKSIVGLKNVKSTSLQDFSVITAEFETYMDIDEAVRKVKDAVDKAKSDLPNDLTQDPDIFDVNLSEIPIMTVNLSGKYTNDELRSFADGVVKKLTGGLAGMAKARKVEVVTGVGRFLDPNHLEVETHGAKKTIRFAKAIIAAGSQSVKLPSLPEDPRIVDSTGALLLASIPKRMLVIGGGIIGLEMATVYSTLGARIDVVEMLDGLMPGADRDLVKVWEKKNAHRFDNIMLKTKTVGAKATKAGIEVSFEGEKAPAKPQVYDLVLVAVGRSPNGKKIDADKAGVAVGERGFISVDRQMRTNVPHIHAIGDIVGQPMLAHKAVHEAHVAAEAAHGAQSFFDARQIPSVAYTDPEIAWAGKTEEQCKAEGLKVGKAVFPWAASGRAIANGRDEGFTKLLFDETTHRIVGGGIVGTNAGDLIGEVCLAVEMGCVPADIGKTIHPHPTLVESIGMAAEVFEGHCTDLPPQKKR